MPEYLAPGVFVEEVSFRAKTIEGVSTSTAGFVGPTRFGPVSGRPELITSRLDFERIYGSLDDLIFSDKGTQPNYVGHAVRAFFEEGGRRLYVTRVFNFGDDGFLPTRPTETEPDIPWNPAPQHGRASNFDPDVIADIGSPPPVDEVRLVARFPGEAGNFRVTFTLRVGANAFNPAPAGGGGPALARIQHLDIVHVANPNVVAGSGGTPANPDGWTPLAGDDGLYLAKWDAAARVWSLVSQAQTFVLRDPLPAALANAQVRRVTVTVDIEHPIVTGQGTLTFGPPETLGEFGFDERSPTGLAAVFARNPRTRREALTTPFALLRQDPPADGTADFLAVGLVRDLFGPLGVGSLLSNPARLRLPADRRQLADERRVAYTLREGSDGELPAEEHYEGLPLFNDFEDDPLQAPHNGLLAFELAEDISIVAAPGYSAIYADDTDTVRVMGTQNAVINHCERMRYRIAVLEVPPDQLVTQALDFRNLRSSKYAAIYYPWVTIPNPLGDGRLDLPPAGFVAGIYARNDIEHAVFKAPANEVVRSAIDFEVRLSKAQQEVLNPAGVNCFRFFEGRGFLLWGARLMTDDPEWKYVNLRRYFAYLEHSIDRGTQWVVFENNGPQLWDTVRRTVEDFLFNEWKMGALLGTKTEDAFFVRCDRSTMTQNDLDNGRLICLIGIAPVRPAEFVIFRIGQFTADSNR